MPRNLQMRIGWSLKAQCTWRACALRIMTADHRFMVVIAMLQSVLQQSVRACLCQLQVCNMRAWNISTHFWAQLCKCIRGLLFHTGAAYHDT